VERFSCNVSWLSVEEDLEFHWQLVESPGTLTGVHGQAVSGDARVADTQLAA
jgi:hypothetical protein